ncbi:MAG: hypothetical protein NTX88_06890 [Candidatus Atribacteria bacterium]|nr:hypothetical protein [Candidatus Atribacteria bacterium]
MELTMNTRREIIKKMAPEYQKATKKEKTVLSRFVGVRVETLPFRCGNSCWKTIYQPGGEYQVSKVEPFSKTSVKMKFGYTIETGGI